MRAYRAPPRAARAITPGSPTRAAQRGHRTRRPNDNGHAGGTLSARKARPTRDLQLPSSYRGLRHLGLPLGAGGRDSDGGSRTGPHQLAPQGPHESQRTGTRYSTQPTTRELQPTLRLATAMLAAGLRCTASLVGPATRNNWKPTPRYRCCKAAAGGSRNVAVRSTTPLGLRRNN